MGGAFFGEQAIRLLRERWDSPQELAEELFTMIAKSSANTTDRPVDITQPDDGPALIIRPSSNPDAGPPIVVQRPGDAPVPYNPTDFGAKCCASPSGGSGGGGSGTGGGGTGGSGTGGVTEAPPPSNTGRAGRLFTASLEIQIHTTGADPFGWEGQAPSFTAIACMPYPPAPASALDFPGIANQVTSFITLPTLAPYFTSYDILVDSVSEPGANCNAH